MKAAGVICVRHQIKLASGSGDHNCLWMRASHLKESESEVTQSCLNLCDPLNCSLPGSSVHRIFQARVLEWGAIAFSGTTYLHTYIQYLIRWESPKKDGKQF